MIIIIYYVFINRDANSTVGIDSVIYSFLYVDHKLKNKNIVNQNCLIENNLQNFRDLIIYSKTV